MDYYQWEWEQFVLSCIKNCLTSVHCFYYTVIYILRACAVKFRFGYTKNVTINLIVQKCIQCFFLSVQQELKSEKNMYI